MCLPLAVLLAPALYAPGLTAWAQTPTQAASSGQLLEVQLLLRKGSYWLERYRYDLAREQFDRALLLSPFQAEALKWQGVLAVQQNQANNAKVWLKQLESHWGAQHPQAVELRQFIAINGELRQTLAEIRYKASNQPGDKSWVRQLQNLLPEPAVGLVAKEFNALLARQTNVANAGAIAVAKASSKGSARPANKQTPNAELAVAPTTPADAETSANPVSNFEQGQALQAQAEAAFQAGDVEQALALLENAVATLPSYPWFRYDLAVALDNTGQPAQRLKASEVMTAGLALNPEPDMVFASALIASRQDRDNDALRLLDEVPRADWTLGMADMHNRMVLRQHVQLVENLIDTGNSGAAAQQIASKVHFRGESQIQALEQQLSDVRQPAAQMGHTSARIDGTSGVSAYKIQETSSELQLSLDYNTRAFVRLENLQVSAGSLQGASLNQAADFGSLAQLEPGARAERIAQTATAQYTGQLIGVGANWKNWRFDLGKPVGDLPVQSWVGGVQLKMDLGAGSLRLDAARRMVPGSVVSMSGAIDPVTGEAWGGARRNGLSAVHYHPIDSKTDWVGIARYNHITGLNIPSNRELNLQGILSRTVWSGAGQKVELGASLFLWQFQKNLRFYTFGQGGYYSPQAFGSLTLPITWTGKTANWAWRTQLSMGASESRESASDRYPGRPLLDAAEQSVLGTQGPTLQYAGGPGGGISTALRVQLERRLMDGFSLGLSGQIDRSEGYNPDSLQVYLRWNPRSTSWQNATAEPLTPYSRF